jgi:hypothetical protein
MEDVGENINDRLKRMQKQLETMIHRIETTKIIFYFVFQFIK